MENLHKAISKILATIMVLAKAYEDKKIVWSEWIQIGGTAIFWTWIFKHIPEIKADLEAATEESMLALMEKIKVEFDIPQDNVEEWIEQCLSIVLLFITMIDKKQPVTA